MKLWASASTRVQGPPSVFDHELMDPCSNGGLSLTHHLEGRSRSGKALTVLMTMTPLRRENGDPVALIGTAIDVTSAANDHCGLEETVVLVEEKSAANH
jgi:hypothetical protein